MDRIKLASGEEVKISSIGGYVVLISTDDNGCDVSVLLSTSESEKLREVLSAYEDEIRYRRKVSEK